MTDTNYGYTAERQARFHSQYAPVYKYVYNYVSQNATTEEWMGESAPSAVAGSQPSSWSASQVTLNRWKHCDVITT